jgi:hypothetical protein
MQGKCKAMQGDARQIMVELVETDGLDFDWLFFYPFVLRMICDLSSGV